jgi:hypothetical protein
MREILEEPAPSSRRRLFFDIETSPCLGYFWRPGPKVPIGYQNIVKESAIICVAWKWEGQKKVHSLTWDEDQDDALLLEEFVDVMHEADEIVGHNSDRFDTPWIRARCVYHEIPMSPEFVSIDTCKLARGGFNFNSNRLDYLAQHLDIGAKMETGGFDLWKQVKAGNKTALRTMVRYCKQDVEILEGLHRKLHAYTTSASRLNADPRACPSCGMRDSVITKRRMTPAGYKKVQLRCRTCGKYHTVAESKLRRALKEK